ncbi:type VII secretion integral membrane protein EccD [Cellulomonas sp. URHD0024]|uniref:type VII secretion integral membrane protein EccD n=1 Tax=Cellulomonas sp. URHD0024 TaxID=1302620 RepID=UPI0004237E22|nr:type VII secretion integral membrane protein EccD [Cellulomonas sp. URHD0024]
MTMTSSSTPVGTLLRLSVTAGERRVDLGVPGNVAVVEIVPGLARTLGLLEAGTAHGGYRLIRADGTPVDGARSLVAQGVEDGAVLSLESGARAAAPRVYDDVVEAVADAVESQYRPWTPRDSALGAAWGAVALVVVSAALLLGADTAATLPPVLAGLGAVLVLVAGAVVGRVGAEPVTGRILVLSSGVLGAVAGFTAGDQPPSWGWPTVSAGVALLLVGLLGVPALADAREISVAPVLLGLVLASTGVAVELTGAESGTVLAVVVAVVITASVGLPWLALSSTPLRVVPARTEAEILLEPAPIDPAFVRQQTQHGLRMQVALRIAVGIFSLLAIPAVAATGAVGTVLLVVGFAGILLSARQSWSRADVLVVVTGAILGLTGTLVAAALLHPQWRGVLTAASGVGAILVVGVGLVAPGRRVGLARLGDVVEVTCLAILLPLGVTAAGLV